MVIKLFKFIALPKETEIITRNAKQFLKPNGFAILAIKARSIDVTKDPRQIYKQELKKLKQCFEILDKVELEPFEKDHCLIVMKFKK